MAKLTSEQAALLKSLGVGTIDGLDDDGLCRVEELLENEMQLHGLNGSGDGLNAHGNACREILVALSED